MGAVPKPLEPGKMRPFSDHTKTGLNTATDGEAFRHTLRTYEEVAAYLKYGFYMRVGDVDAAPAFVCYGGRRPWRDGRPTAVGERPTSLCCRS